VVSLKISGSGLKQTIVPVVGVSPKTFNSVCWVPPSKNLWW